MNIGKWGKNMSADFAMMLSKEMLWTALLISAPVLGLSMLVGLAISVLQVVTQVQEMSLTFVPKILAVLLGLLYFAPWMLGKLVTYTETVFQNIPLYIR